MRRIAQLTLLGLSLLGCSLLGLLYVQCVLLLECPELLDSLCVLIVTVLYVLHRQVKELPSIPVCLLLWLGASLVPAMLVPGYFRAQPQGRLTACKSNTKNLATALEMYSSDNAGHYPRSLVPLIPNYLKTLPQCPSVRRNTYAYWCARKPDAYTVFCVGLHHHAAGLDVPNYPQYSSYSGLLLP